MLNQITWLPLGEHKIDKPTANSQSNYRYPHTIPDGWQELRAWSGIATNPVWRVIKGQHNLVIAENVAYRLIERSMFYLGAMPEPVIQREILRRVVTCDWNWNSKSRKWMPTTKSSWRFVDFDHYLTLDEIKEQAEDYHQWYVWMLKKQADEQQGSLV